MYFVGDIAHHENVCFPNPPNIFLNGCVIANLEGAIAPGDRLTDKRRAVYNDASVLQHLTAANVKLVSLANNHIFDIGHDLSETRTALEQHDILFCGAGGNIAEAARPAQLQIGGADFVLQAFGWAPIDCPPATHARPGVLPLAPRFVMEQAALLRERFAESKLIFLMHWDYELELYPQPMHRQLAFAAIDAGVDAIIGCHSHCVQGIEFYKQRPIVYSLGNWWMPHGVFMGGRLAFPEIANLELAFEWDPDTGASHCHFFRYDSRLQTLRHESSTRTEDSETIRALTPFAGFSHEKYVQWFRTHRRKKKGLPVYSSMQDTLGNQARDQWVATRNFMIRQLVALNLKGGRR